ARTVLVQTWYQRFLNRQAANADAQFWVQQLLQGSTEAQVMSAILSSPEFQSQAANQTGSGTNTGKFVQALYSQILGRAASNSDVTFWTQVTNQSGAAAVAQNVLASKEFRTNTLTGLYDAVLNRSPDTQGLNFWIGAALDLTAQRLGFTS